MHGNTRVAAGADGAIYPRGLPCEPHPIHLQDSTSYNYCPNLSHRLWATKQVPPPPPGELLRGADPQLAHHCIFNPAVVHVAGDDYLWLARAFMHRPARGPGGAGGPAASAPGVHPCAASPVPHQWFHSWRGEQLGVVAVVRHVADAAGQTAELRLLHHQITDRFLAGGWGLGLRGSGGWNRGAGTR